MNHLTILWRRLASQVDANVSDKRTSSSSGLWRRVASQVDINVFEKLVSTWESTRRHNPEQHRNLRRRENLKSHIGIIYCLPLQVT